MEFNKALFCIRPKTFKSIYVYLTMRESFPMVNYQVSVTAEHQRIITSKFIGVDNRNSPNGFDRVGEQLMVTNILDYCNLNKTFSLKNTEYRSLVPGTTTARSFSPATEKGTLNVPSLIACRFS